MGRDLSRIGSADEAQTPPASVPLRIAGSGRSRRLIHGRLAQQRALAEFGQTALRATALEPLLAEADALLHRAYPDRASGISDLDGDADEVAFAKTVAEMVDAAAGTLRIVETSRHAALHDPLTGLANRSMILDRLQLALTRAGRQSTLAAVIFVDLDAFKQINDTLGHGAGDELLVQVAERLRPAVRPADTLGRWGGDEFVVVCEDLEQASDAPAIVSRVAAAFAAPFDIAAAAALHVCASIGVAVSAGTDQPATLIHAADTDMYRAKRDHVHGSDGHGAEGLPFLAGLVKHERLNHRLLEVLSSLELDDTSER